MTKDKMLSIRFEPEVELKIRQEATALKIDVSEYIRLAFDIGRPTILEHPVLTVLKLNDSRFKK